MAAQERRDRGSGRDLRYRARDDDRAVAVQGELGELTQDRAERDEPAALALRVAVLQERCEWPALRALAAEFVRRAPAEAAGWEKGRYAEAFWVIDTA